MLAHSQVLRFGGGQNTFLGGQYFCFYYMFKQILLGATKFGPRILARKFGPKSPRMPRVATGLR